MIVALTRERELILERNWRAPLESFVIQIFAPEVKFVGKQSKEINEEIEVLDISVEK